MRYMGSKNRIAKYILSIMFAARKCKQYWVEPFVGGGNVIDKVEGLRIGNDINSYVIEALIAIRDCVEDLPKTNEEFTEEDYKKLRFGDEYKYKGYAGFAFSFCGKWFGSWRKDGKNRRDYVNEAYRSAVRQSLKLKGVLLLNKDYRDLEMPAKSLIYCDPPYKGKIGYVDSFDSEVFWDWCRGKSDEGHTVFISEYVAPNDFECVWQKEIVNNITRKSHVVEKLFKYKHSKFWMGGLWN